MKKRIQQLLLFIALLFAAQVASAQITGTVTSADDGEPLIGVSVLVKGTTKGAYTDMDGKYTVAASAGDVLVFTYTGMVTQEVKAQGKELNVGMNADVETLEEVMVVAYGTTTKRTFTGSASTVKGKEIAKLQTGNVTKALEGAAAGVQFASSSGQPGSSGSIRIRGIGSISATTTPLYVVDGMPYEGDISSISASDIESMTVLKDAAANSLYGSRASNGVILITTKKGQAGAVRVTVDARVGVNQRAVPNYDVMDDPAMYYQMTWEAMRNDQHYRLGYSWAEAAMYASGNMIKQLGGYNNYYAPDNGIIDPTTGRVYSSARLAYHDTWDDEMFKQGTRQEYSATIAGGDSKTSYFLSFGYLNDEGYVVNSDFERYNTRVKLDREVTKWLKVGTNLTYSHLKRNSVQEANTAGDNMFYMAQVMAPIFPVYLYNKDTKQPVYDSKGNRRFDFGDDGGYARPVASMTNPVASQSLDKNNADWNIFNGKFFADIKVWEFKLTVNYSVDVSNNLGLQYQNGLYGQFKDNDGVSSRRGERNVTQSANQLLTWGKEFGKHSIDVLAGHESYENDYNAWSAKKEKFLDPDQIELAGAIKNPAASSSASRYALESYLSRVQYNYADRYYLTASFRRDGSSRFHPDSRWGNFWSVGGSWRMNEEEFMSGAEWLSELKLKASYGTQGNDNLAIGGDAPWADQLQIVANGEDIALVRVYRGNKDISWEKSGTFNAGFDYAVLNRRLSGSLEYFYKKTSDMLFSRPIAPSSGDASYPDNIGDMVNQGVEFDLTGVLLKTRDFEWTANINATHFTNEIVKLPPERSADGITNGNFKLMEGRSIYDYYIKDYAGLTADGRSQWYMDVKDANGNVTGVTTTTDHAQATDYYQGNAVPKIYGGLGTSLSYKGVDFSIQTAYQLGGKGYDAAYASTMTSYSYGQNMHKDMLNRWTPNYTDTDVPRLQSGNDFDNRSSSRWFVSSNYFNIKNITLGYTFPKAWVNKVNIATLRVYAVADNVYLFSARRGYDPRTSWSGASTQGLYAPIRTISLGLNLSF